MVCSVMNTLENMFIDPFDTTLDVESLYNLVSGAPTSCSVADGLLSLEKNGKIRKEEFESRLTSETSEPTSEFFSTLKQFKFESFESSNIKAFVKKDGKKKEISHERDVLGKLVSQSYASKKGVDMEVVLTYPLAPVSIPLSTSDGSIRKTVKSKLFDSAMSGLRIVDPTQLPNVSLYFLDLVAAIRTMSGTLGTIREFTWKILNTVPMNYSTVFLVCDTYGLGSIKSGERIARGMGKRYVCFLSWKSVSNVPVSTVVFKISVMLNCR